MRIFLAGVSCVGKTSIGTKLAELLDYPFFDLDDEVEIFFSTPIERLQDQFLTMYSFREEASKALKNLINQKETQNSVIALPPSGLMDNYWKIVQKTRGIIIVLTDDAVNIMKRITFYDKDSKPIRKDLTDEEQKFYLKEIKKDLSYFKRTYKKADICVNISGLNTDQSAEKVKETLNKCLK